jgi:hypothetical protein
MWTTITEAYVLTKLTGAELTALKTAALATGQDNPLPEVITQVVAEVRGYVAGCANNMLGEGETVPSELLGAALARIRFELAGRLPVATLLTEDRRTANTNAITLLRDVMRCDFKIIPPETAADADEQAAGGAAEVISTTTRRATRDKLDGL